MIYIKTPVIIVDAVLFDGYLDLDNCDEWIKQAISDNKIRYMEGVWQDLNGYAPGRIDFKDKNGKIECRGFAGEYIVRTEIGMVYPCNAKFFEDNYLKLDEVI